MSNRTSRLLLVFLFLSCGKSMNAQSFSVYYVSVGSAHYTPDFNKYDKGFSGLLNVPAANKSATEIAKMLDESGARGILVTSSKENYITVDKVYQSIDEMLERIKKDRPTNPFFVFYFCGHGLSEGLGWNLLMIPGNFTYNIAKRKLDEVDEKTLPVSYVWDAIHEKLKELPFMLIADCCYEGDDALPEVKALKAYNSGFSTTMQLTEDAAKITRAFNEFHEPNSVVFSSSPGNSVSVVELPGGKGEKVGPMCRRWVKSFNAHSSLTWKELVIALTVIPDEKCKPGVTFWEGNEKESYRIK